MPWNDLGCDLVMPDLLAGNNLMTYIEAGTDRMRPLSQAFSKSSFLLALISPHHRSDNAPMNTAPTLACSLTPSGHVDEKVGNACNKDDVRLMSTSPTA